MDRFLHRFDYGRARAVVGVVACAYLTAGLLHAQLVTNVAQIPNTGKPPVVFVNGYQGGCSGVTFAGTFGVADQVMQRDGRASVFFDSCTVGPNSTPIEELGNGFGRFLESLRYTNGDRVPQVDVIAHSMGGLIVRSYLAGKQVTDGVFTPPLVVPIRKVVFLATPHFGTPIGAQANTRQGQQLNVASDFIFDLATWNQGQDDLRGVDYVSVLGTAGTSAVALLVPGWEGGFHDSTVSLMSGSLDFTPVVDRNRIVNHCHTALGGLLSIGCSNGVPRIAEFTSDQHESAQVALSFLNSTEAWRSVGQSLAQVPSLRDNAGLMVRWHNAQDQPVAITGAGWRPQGSTGAFENLQRREDEIAHRERIPAGTVEVRLTSGDTTLTATQELRRGAYRAFTFKPGPVIAAVAPVFGPVFPRAAAPGMFVSLYGTFGIQTPEAAAQPYPTALAGVQVLAGDRPIQVQYVSTNQINAVIPDDAAGFVKMTVRAPAGQHTVNVLIEPAVPTLFATAVNAVTGALITAAAPARPGEILSVYLTGLGATDRRADNLEWARQQPEVTLGNARCELQYAGRSPGFVGLDQINCVVPAGIAPGDLSLTVRSGNRVSNSIVVPVR